MSISTIESDLALSQRLKAARRIALATASILRTCGVKVSTAPKPSMSRNNVYRVEGFPGDIIGVDGLRGWLWDHGVKGVAPSAVSKAAKEGRPFRGYRITLVGTVARQNKAVKFKNQEAV